MIVYTRGCFGHGVETKAREGQLAHMGFAEANEARFGCVLKHPCVAIWHAVFEEGGARFCGCTRCIKQVFPAHGNAIKQAAA